MTPKPISQTWLDRWFKLILVFKGIDGVLELIGGGLLLVVSAASLHDLIHLSARSEFIGGLGLADTVRGFGDSVTDGTRIYTAVYLLLHGVIKVGLVIALLSRRYRLYPAAIVVLILFMAYQIYRIIFEGQILFDATLTVIDAVVVWLTIIEYRRHTRGPELPTR